MRRMPRARAVCMCVHALLPARCPQRPAPRASPRAWRSWHRGRPRPCARRTTARAAAGAASPRRAAAGAARRRRPASLAAGCAASLAGSARFCNWHLRHRDCASSAEGFLLFASARARGASAALAPPRGHSASAQSVASARVEPVAAAACRAGARSSPTRAYSPSWCPRWGSRASRSRSSTPSTRTPSRAWGARPALRTQRRPRRGLLALRACRHALRA